MSAPTGAAAPLILLVEDAEAIRAAFCILLEESGYRVAQAATGAEAMRAVAADPPDLILMDLGLPDAHGLEVTSRLKAATGTRHIPIVALTGHALESDQRACLAAGCRAYLAKPINTRELLAALPGWLADG